MVITRPLRRRRSSLRSILTRIALRCGAPRTQAFPRLADLGVIGDRRTAAVVTRAGEICWFCPGRFDAPSLFASLLDTRRGGSWRIILPGARPATRSYLGDSGILRTTLHHPRGDLVMTDWMPLAGTDGLHGALCRLFDAAPSAFRMVVTPRPGYARAPSTIRLATDRIAAIDERFYLQASHALEISGGTITMRVRGGEQSWAVLADAAAASATVDRSTIERWCRATEEGWERLAARTTYDGSYVTAVRASLRAVRLLTYSGTGAIAAAVTSSLPEVQRGKRNYDYRYSWLRDSGIVVRALIRVERDGDEARRYFRYVGGLLDAGYQSPLDPVSTVGGERVPPQRRWPVRGYRGAKPSLIGNKAVKQLQLGSLAHFVLSAADFYATTEDRSSWRVVSRTADFLARRWRRRSHGIWEEPGRRHYTSDLVLTACALEALSRFADRHAAAGWTAAATSIRRFVAKHCQSREGVFRSSPKSKGVDISTALFSVWDYVPADHPAMDATMRQLVAENGHGNGLYQRYLFDARAAKREGAFLVGTFWIAHHRLRGGDLAGCRTLIEQGLRHANDLGLFSEGIDPGTGDMLGNLPMALVHGSLLAVLADLHAAETGPQ